MGTENTQQTQGQPGGKYANTAFGRATQAMMEKLATQQREQYQLDQLEAQRQQQGRKAQNINIAEQNRQARSARQAPGSAPNPALSPGFNPPQRAPIGVAPRGAASNPWG